MGLRQSSLALAVSLLVASWIPSSATAASVPLPASAPCGAAGPAHYAHVVWIMLENEGYSVVGSPAAPYLNRLADACGLATNYLAVGHPSLPNYIALTSGSTQGIADDGEPSEHPLSVLNLFGELDGNWRTYAESMPTACDRVTSGTYAARHNPAVYYVALATTCHHDDLPLAGSPSFASRFTMIVPNICDDMHSCPVSIGDAWLSRMVPSIIASAQYQARSLVLFITFDENDTSSLNRVPTYVIAPTVPRGVRVATALTHYSLLRTTEVLLGVPLLGGARSAPSMIGPFGL